MDNGTTVLLHPPVVWEGVFIIQKTLFLCNKTLRVDRTAAVRNYVA